MYAAQSIALAVLEVLVHLDKSEIPDDYAVLAIEIQARDPRSMSVAEARKVEILASGPSSSAELFQRKYYSHPVLRVPSVIIPRENIYVLLPESAAFQAHILWVEPFQFDQRLFTQVGA